MKITEMKIAVEFPVQAPASEVWEVLSDIPRMASWSPECVQAGWLDDAPVGPGSEFAATNKMGDWSWNVTGRIVAMVKPDIVTWVVKGLDEDTDQPSSTWSYELSALPDGGTLITHTFIHGHGGSHLVTLAAENPDHADAIVAARAQMLRDNMLQTLTKMANHIGWAIPAPAPVAST